MAKARCPECGEMKFINPGKLINENSNFSARWWTIEVHKNPKKQELCLGSGRQV